MNEHRTSCKLFVILSILSFFSACTNNNVHVPDSETMDLDDRFSEDRLETGQNKETEEAIVLIESNSELVKALRFSGADAQATQRGVVINLPDAFFEFDRYVLTPDAIRALTEISRVLKGVPERSFSVEGHTDYIGRVTYNKDLSLKRASSVASELKSQGVKGREILVKGFGEGYPVATNNSELGRSRNRRVEIVISNN